MTVTATPDAGYRVSSWGTIIDQVDKCSTAGTATSCTFTKTAATFVKVTFVSDTLTVTPLTWDIVGLDSNQSATSGPAAFPVGARVCNTGATSYTGVSARFTWDSSNPYISLSGGVSQVTLGALAPNACADAYFLIAITRTSLAFNTTRKYHIVFQTNNDATATTPTGRQIKVESLVSQNRNSIQAIKGGTCSSASDWTTCNAAPTALAVGSTYTYKLFGTTTSAHDRVTSFITFDPTIFQVLSVTSTYATPAGATGTSPFANACGTQPDPTLAATYETCVGPPQYSGEAVGGNSVLTYQVKVIGVGSTGLTGLFFDLSGGSYHYNSDYSTFAKIDVTSSWPLNVNVTGGGTVSSSDGGISSCTASAGTCSAKYSDGTTVTLTAAANAGSRFVGWSGAQCAGSSTTCTLRMIEAQYVYATFTAIGSAGPWPLSVVMDGLGTGTVTSSPAGVSCATSGGTCSALFSDGTTVTLTQSADPLMLFGGWSGDTTGATAGTCTLTSLTCVVPMTDVRTIHALFDVDPVLTVSVYGNGNVTSSSGGISCGTAGTSCVGNYAEDAIVTLTETPDAGTTFTGWGGACSGTATTCTVTMNVAKTVTATFGNTVFGLAVTLLGSGVGTVTSSPVGINCGDTCSYGYNSGTSVTLTSAASANATFTGWGGACTGSSSTCTITMNAIKSVTATFVQTWTLTVTQIGSGTVSSSPSGISLAAAGSANATYTDGTDVTLTATPASGFRISNWSGGGCSGTASTCVVTVNDFTSVTVTFVQTYSLTLVQSGTGNISSNPSGITSTGTGTTSSSFDTGTSVVLTATQVDGWRFSGWGGSCAGSSSTCTVSVTSAKSVTATFIQTFVLSATQVGNGAVSSNPAGISLAAAGSGTASYDTGTSVTLTATADTGWRFSGWSGSGCSGTGTCTVTMSADRTVTATFVKTYVLSVTQVGNGTVSSSPSGVSLAAAGSASATYDTGTSVTLTATADTGWRFSGWSGSGCSGTGTCTVTMSADRTVTATFVKTYVLSVTQVGNGTVSSSPSGVSLAAAGSASATYDTGTSVTLTATADTGWRFSGWSGSGCSGTGTCTVTMSADRTVTATFVKTYVLSVTQVGTGGSIGSSDNVITISTPSTSTATYDTGSSVTLTASASSGWRFLGWSGGTCSGTSTSCAVTMDQARTVTATFVQTYVLSVTQVGNGTVSSSPSGVSLAAAGSASATYDTGTSVTLTATADTGWRFSGWSGSGCSGTGTCTVTMSADRTVTATFVKTYVLSVTQVGTGGSIGSSDNVITISTPSTSTATYDTGSSVTLTASASSGWRFAGWSSGTCSGTSTTCTFTMSADRTVTATFVKVYVLTVNQVGNGTITTPGSAISTSTDGETGSATYDKDESVVISATASSGWRIASWSGAGCSGTMNDCTVTMDGAKSVTVTFELIPPGSKNLLVIVNGAGGSVSSSPSGISLCADGSGTCGNLFTDYTVVTLTATASGAGEFRGWSGEGCSGTGTCTVTMSQSRTITAEFVEVWTLSTTQVGNGSVSSSPSGISLAAAGSTSHGYDSGTSVTLTATAASGWRFSGWSGDCSGTGTCTVSMTSTQSVTATFVRVWELTVSRTGSGSVSSSPSGISLSSGSSTSASFDTGTSVTLTATAASGWRFSGWSGDCSGTGTCTVSMTAARSVGATFVRTYVLTATQVGNGTTASGDSAISRASAGTTTSTYDTGTSVTLTATAASGWRFWGWSGDCAGTGTCSVTMSSDASVTATFIRVWTLTVSRTGSGTVSSNPSGISLTSGSSTSASYDEPTSVTLTATPAAGWMLSAWGGACSGAGSCSVTMDQARTVSATFVEIRSLAVTQVGSGSTSSDVTGISLVAASSASASFANGTSVVLMATPAAGWQIAGWGGDCSSSGTASTCSVTMSADKSVTITYELIPPPPKTLNVTVVGAGGTANSDVSGISSCTASSGTCSATFADSSVVTVNVTLSSGWYVSSWSGASCTGTASSCAVTMSSNQSVTVTVSQTRDLQATQVGDGSLVTSPSGITLTTASTATAAFTNGSSVTLTATPASGWRISSWGGGSCSGTATTCTVTMNGAKTVTVTFVQTSVLTVTVVGNGSVVSNPSGITMTSAGTSSATFDTGTAVSLAGTPDQGWRLRDWTQSCTGTTDSCALTMAVRARSACATVDSVCALVAGPARAVTVTYIPVWTLTVSQVGNGTVTSSPAAVSLVNSSSSSYVFDDGTTVTMNASPAAGYIVSGWSGGSCSGAALSCTVTMTQARNVTITYVMDPNVTVHALSVAVTGGGTVTARTPEASVVLSGCTESGGGQCSASLPAGTTVVLSSEPQTGWVFGGWSGDATGTGCATRGTCTVVMDKARKVSASFTRVWRMTVVPGGTGAGEISATVNASPSGISLCTSTSGVCVSDYDEGASVTLRATVGKGSVFSGWSGECDGSHLLTCVVAMTKARRITPQFTSTTKGSSTDPTSMLSAAVVGDGQIQFGGVTVATSESSWSGSFPQTAKVTLVAKTKPGWAFTGWSGACATTTECVVSLATSVSVKAHFERSNETTPRTGADAMRPVLLGLLLVGIGLLLREPKRRRRNRA